MTKPTEAQIKVFWLKQGLILHYPDGCYYEQSLGRQFAHDGTIDLNNLFKYAVPFLIDEFANSMARKGAVDLDFCRLWIMTEWLKAWNDNPEDPAMALFWALDKIREASK